MLQIKAAINCGFGNGTRRRGFVFGTVELAAEKGIYQLLQEMRPRAVTIEELKTAKVELSESVTKREFVMALNNINAMEITEPEADVAEFSIKDFKKLKVDDAIAKFATLTEEQQAEVRGVEKRKGVLDGIGPDPQAWKEISIESLEMSDDTTLAVLELKLKTLGEVQEYVDKNGGLKELTEEMTNELFAAMKPHITGEV